MENLALLIPQLSNGSAKIWKESSSANWQMIIAPCFEHDASVCTKETWQRKYCISSKLLLSQYLSLLFSPLLSVLLKTTIRYLWAPGFDILLLKILSKFCHWYRPQSSKNSSVTPNDKAIEVPISKQHTAVIDKSIEGAKEQQQLATEVLHTKQKWIAANTRIPELWYIQDTEDDMYVQPLADTWSLCFQLTSVTCHLRSIPVVSHVYIVLSLPFVTKKPAGATVCLQLAYGLPFLKFYKSITEFSHRELNYQNASSWPDTSSNEVLVNLDSLRLRSFFPQLSRKTKSVILCCK